MINYVNEAEKILKSRGTLTTALINLERRRDRIIENKAPAEYSSIDFTTPYTSVKNVNDALSDCLSIAEVVREIEVTRETIQEIDIVLSQLEPEENNILRLWYIERKPKEKISVEMNYSSATSVYDLRNKAVSHFALLYFGAGALASV